MDGFNFCLASPEDAFPANGIRDRDQDLAVQPPRPSERRVQGVGSVGGSDHHQVTNVGGGARGCGAAAGRSIPGRPQGTAPGPPLVLGVGSVEQRQQLSDYPGLVLSGPIPPRAEGVNLQRKAVTSRPFGA